MVTRIGIKMCFSPINSYFTEQPGFCELVQGVINCGKRHWQAGLHCFFEQEFSRDVPVSLRKK
jgi:hypothetical protein